MNTLELKNMVSEVKNLQIGLRVEYIQLRGVSELVDSLENIYIEQVRIKDRKD